ncbi:MAG TPA: diacylglycerol kinase [Tenericutes bacterium]|jgi:diacylglycerol kinase (ATP)|nr:diacylglycerol kinase [Mycoplasmatota bacterium]
MSVESKDKNIQKNKHIFSSFMHSCDGLKEAFKTERSLLVLLLATVATVLLGIHLKLELLEWIIIIFVILFVAAVELINTAIEDTVDLVTKTYNPLAKIAKDTASAATLMAVIAAVIVVLAIFISKFMEILY